MRIIFWATCVVGDFAKDFTKGYEANWEVKSEIISFQADFRGFCPHPKSCLYCSSTPGNGSSIGGPAVLLAPSTGDVSSTPKNPPPSNQNEAGVGQEPDTKWWHHLTDTCARVWSSPRHSRWLTDCSLRRCCDGVSKICLLTVTNSLLGQRLQHEQQAAATAGTSPNCSYPLTNMNNKLQPFHPLKWSILGDPSSCVHWSLWIDDSSAKSRSVGRISADSKSGNRLKKTN